MIQLHEKRFLECKHLMSLGGMRALAPSVIFWLFLFKIMDILKRHQDTLSVANVTQTQHDNDSKKTIRSHHRDTEEQ